MKGNILSDNDFDHPSYAAPFNYESSLTGFSYLKPGQVNAGFTGEPRVDRYDSEDDEDD